MASLSRSVMKGSVLGLLAQGLALPIGLVSVRLYVDGLGYAGFAHWGLLQSVFAALNLLSVGTTEATMYFVARDSADPLSESSRSRTRVLFFLVMSGCLAGGLALALGPYYGLAALLGLPAPERADFDRVLLPAAALWCCQFWCLWLQLLPRARNEYGVLTWNQVALTLAVPLLALCGLKLSGGSEAWFFWGQAAAWALGCLSLHVWNQRHAQPLDFRPGLDKAVLGEVGQYTRWAFVFMLSMVLLNSTDRFLLTGLGDRAMTGYTVATSLTLRVYAVSGMMTATLLPAMARIKEGMEIERLRRGFSLSVRALGYLWAALLLPLAAWGDQFVSVWMKKPDLAAEVYPALVLLCCGAFFGALASACHAALLGSGRARLAAVTGVAGGLAGLAVALWAVPRYGLAGAALLGLCGNATAFALRLAFMERARFGRPLWPLAAEAFLGLASVAALYVLLRLLAPTLASMGSAALVAAMLSCAALLLLLGLSVDALISPFRDRQGLYQALLLRGA
jgi:O-antigen/teichoic acid export membrane protein